MYVDNEYSKPLNMNKLLFPMFIPCYVTLLYFFLILILTFDFFIALYNVSAKALTSSLTFLIYILFYLYVLLM